MNSRTRQYFFGLIFFAIGVYYFVKVDYLEASLYCLAGLCFAFNSLVGEPRLAAYKRVLNVVAWVLIAITGILFLWVLQFKYF
jgi:hypothetical protein